METTNEKRIDEILIDVFEMVVERLNTLESSQETHHHMTSTNINMITEHMKYIERTKYGDIIPSLFLWHPSIKVQRLRWDGTTNIIASNDVTVAYETNRMIVNIKSPGIISWKKYANMLVSGNYDDYFVDHEIDMDTWKRLEHQHLQLDEWDWIDPMEINVPGEDVSEWFYEKMLAKKGQDDLGLQVVRLQPSCDDDKIQLWLKHSRNMTVDEWVHTLVELVGSIESVPTHITMYDVHPEVSDVFLYYDASQDDEISLLNMWVQGMTECTRKWKLERARKEDWLIMFGIDDDDLEQIDI